MNKVDWHQKGDYRSLGLRMSVNFTLNELPEEFCQLSHNDQLVIIRAGTIMYSKLKDGMYKSWGEMMSSEEATRIQQWIEEGRKLERDSVSDKIVENARLTELLRIANVTNERLRASFEEEVSHRIEQRITSAVQDVQLTHLKEICSLREKIAELEVKEKLYVYIEETNHLVKERLASTEAQKESLQSQLLELTAENTRSSHTIGKIGEATVLELLENTVLKEFPYSSVKDMSAVAHAADFHLWIMTPKGKRVKILVDSKKYKRRISTDDVNKLISDVDKDDDAECGIMISLDSQICNMNLFQIKNTPKNKPIIYLSFEDIEDEQRKKIICWAINSLLAVVNEINQSSRSHMVEDIEQLLIHLSTSVKEIDNIIKSQSRVIDQMRQTRDTLLARISDFSNGHVEDNKSEESSEGEEYERSCITVLRKTGRACGLPAMPGSAKCRAHTSRKAVGGAGSGSVGGR